MLSVICDEALGRSILVGRPLLPYESPDRLPCSVATLRLNLIRAAGWTRRSRAQDEVVRSISGANRSEGWPVDLAQARRLDHVVSRLGPLVRNCRMKRPTAGSGTLGIAAHPGGWRETRSQSACVATSATPVVPDGRRALPSVGSLGANVCLSSSLRSCHARQHGRIPGVRRIHR